MWGWTVGDGAELRLVRIVPTHVGVDRRLARSSSRPAALSPRMWGWTVHAGVLRHQHAIVPTHVGVDREGSRPVPPSPDCPHACGGGPPPGAGKIAPF